jgi:ABC-type polar amino acid transport system ATPase subunit
MGWAKGKSRGKKCKVCGKFFQSHGMGPHMRVHNKIEVGPLRAEKVNETLDEKLRRLLLKAAGLRNEADRIEEAVDQVRQLTKLLT